MLIQNENLPPAVIVDIDGTVALRGDRSPFDWAKVGLDAPNTPVIELVQLLCESHRILFVSGRDAVCRSHTCNWLREYDLGRLFSGSLFMRPEGDQRKDVVVKQEIFDNHIRGKYNVKFVLDDRNQTVQGWRDLGLTCLQVAEGDF